MVVVMIMTMVMVKIDENYPILEANKAKMKIPENLERFQLNPGIKNIRKSRPEKSRIEILDTARAW